MLVFYLCRPFES